MTPQPQYTELANHAVELAKLFSLFVANPPMPTDGGVFAIELTTPHGPSTGGGAQVLQHIRFVHGDLSIVVGSIDQIAGCIELRGYDHLDELFQRRWRRPLPFVRPAFEAFVLRVRAFAKTQHHVVVIKEVAPAPAVAWQHPRFLGTLVGLALAVGVAAALH